MNLDITLSFGPKSDRLERFHVCAVNGNSWESMRSYVDETAAVEWADRKQQRDPLRDIRVLDRLHGTELAF